MKGASLRVAAKLRDARVQVLKAKIGELPIATLLTPLEACLPSD
jgi:hypothetical protein